jgi:hypothetical protein
MSISTSIYIPRMSVHHTETSIREIMYYHFIGNISHIDFTPINKKPGFGENVDQVVKSAFVHFTDPCYCMDNVYRFEKRNYRGNTKFWQTINDGEPYKIQVSQNEYWICLKNKNPVKRTMMNIHQVVENGRYLEKIIEDQAKKIEELESVQNNLYQLLAGIFHKSEQYQYSNRLEE